MNETATQAQEMQARVGYMSQRFTLYNDLTARENIRFYGLAYGLSREALKRRQVGGRVYPVGAGQCQ